MLAALDVQYTDTAAHAAVVLFDEWTSTESIASFTASEAHVADYEPGKFYMRELSPLLKVIAKINCDIDTYVIDGYCHLSAGLAPGLGVYLHESLSKSAKIVGVAKNRYRDSRHAAEVLRATSTRPLFVTSIGIDYDLAARYVESMGGEFRIPKMLKAVDRLARDVADSGPESAGKQFL